MKNLKNLGKVLDKKEQKSINGGANSILHLKDGGYGGSGESQYCLGRPNGYQVMINGYMAVCTGNGGEYYYL